MQAAASIVNRTFRRTLGAFAGVCASWKHPAACGLLAGTVAVLAAWAPEPNPVPRRWELDFKPGDLRVVTVQVPEIGARQYLYLTYTVENNSGEDLLFAPSFELSNGEGEVIRSGRDVPPAVTTELIRSTQNQFVQDQIAIVGEILQGEENAKHGLVIWPLTDTNPDKLTVYAAGFSGETATVTSPDGKETFLLRKTVMLDYAVPGRLDGLNWKALELRERQWIMR